MRYEKTLLKLCLILLFVPEVIDIIIIIIIIIIVIIIIIWLFIFFSYWTQSLLLAVSV